MQNLAARGSTHGRISRFNGANKLAFHCDLTLLWLPSAQVSLLVHLSLRF